MSGPAAAGASAGAAAAAATAAAAVAARSANVAEPGRSAATPPLPDALQVARRAPRPLGGSDGGPPPRAPSPVTSPSHRVEVYRRASHVIGAAGAVAAVTAFGTVAAMGRLPPGPNIMVALGAAGTCMLAGGSIFKAAQRVRRASRHGQIFPSDGPARRTMPPRDAFKTFALGIHVASLLAGVVATCSAGIVVGSRGDGLGIDSNRAAVYGGGGIAGGLVLTAASAIAVMVQILAIVDHHADHEAHVELVSQVRQTTAPDPQA